MKKIIFIIGSFLLMIPVTVKAQTASPGITGGFTFTYNDKKFPVPNTILENWKHPSQLNPSNITAPSITDILNQSFGVDSTKPVQNYDYDIGAIYEYILQIAKPLEQPVMEPAITVTDNHATGFIAPQDGIIINARQSAIQTAAALQNNETGIPLIVQTTHPQGNLSNLNDLGINELIASGQSSFKGSPNNRRHNIKIGVEKMTGVIISPGEEFSFNKFLGPVEAAEGFKPELVIKKEGTVPELGGGLCQVSSTTFRAAMQAGLPITQRRNHAYAVQYYSPQGTDATIYPGVVDLKFVNDTPGHILIWPHFTDENTLFFDFYGTKDNRQVTLEKPIIYDRKSDGSMKATWQREVTKDGNTRTDIFKSVYQSPALFHKTQSFPTTTPITGLQFSPSPSTQISTQTH